MISIVQGSIEHLLLQSEDKVYLYLSGNQQLSNGNGHSNGLSLSVGCDVGWQVIQLPQLYIHNNWPIKVSSSVSTTFFTGCPSTCSSRVLTTLDSISLSLVNTDSCICRCSHANGNCSATLGRYRPTTGLSYS
jgi:hypothetical protein